MFGETELLVDKGQYSRGPVSFICLLNKKKSVFFLLSVTVDIARIVDIETFIFLH